MGGLFPRRARTDSRRQGSIQLRLPRPLLEQFAEAWKDVTRALHDDDDKSITVDLLSLLSSATYVASMAVAPVASAVATPLVGTVVSGKLRLLSELAGAGTWNVPLPRRTLARVDAQGDPMHSLVDKVNLLLGEFRQSCRDVVFVVDGLDRIMDPNTARLLFCTSRMLGRLDTRMVVGTPCVLRNDPAVTSIAGFEWHRLVTPPVIDPQRPTEPGPGTAFLTEVFRARVQDLGSDDWMTPNILARLAYASGGRVRDFVKLVGAVAERVWDEGADAPSEAHLQQVLERARILCETGLDRGHWAILRRVLRDPQRRLPAGDLARELLLRGRLVCFSDTSDRFYPHPLLMMGPLNPDRLPGSRPVDLPIDPAARR